MSSTTRRAALTALASAPALAIPAALASPGPSLTPADLRALDLWKRYRKVQAASDHFWEQYCAAVDRMPEWARPGPKWVCADGSPASGSTVGWPAVEDLSQAHASTGWGRILARPQVEDIYDRWGFAARNGDVDATRKLVGALAAYEKRREQQKLEEERSGSYRANERMEAATEVLSMIEREIEVIQDKSVLALAGKLMIEIRADDTDNLAVLRASLAAIRPRLIGPIAEDADRALASAATVA
jgi:hypothetical protein